MREEYMKGEVEWSGDSEKLDFLKKEENKKKKKKYGIKSV